MKFRFPFLLIVELCSWFMREIQGEGSWHHRRLTMLLSVYSKERLITDLYPPHRVFLCQDVSGYFPLEQKFRIAFQEILSDEWNMIFQYRGSIPKVSEISCRKFPSEIFGWMVRFSKYIFSKRTLHMAASPEIWIDQSGFSGFSRRENLFCP